MREVLALQFDRSDREPASRGKSYHLPHNHSVPILNLVSFEDPIIYVLLEQGETPKQPPVDNDVLGDIGHRSKYPAFMSAAFVTSIAILLIGFFIIGWSVFSRSEKLVTIALLLLTISVGSIALISKKAERIYEQH